MAAVALNASHFAQGGKNYCQVSMVPPLDSATRTNVNLVLLMDVSGSMGTAATVDIGGTQTDVGFSMLDITKHAMKTVIETMKEGDKLSVVAFSSFATVVSELAPMTAENKELAKKHVTDQVPSGCTNMWEALSVGLGVLEKAGEAGQLNNSMSSVLLMTDGIPSEHLLPEKGILGCLKERMADFKGTKPTIHSFGFGYDLDTKLLMQIASEGDGAFSFVPDSGFVGTVLVHAVANNFTCIGSHATLTLNPQGGARVKKVVGYTGEQTVSVDSIHCGQEKAVLIEMENCDDTACPLKVTLKYTDVASREVVVDADAQTTATPPEGLKQEILRSELVDLLMVVLANGADIQASARSVDEFLSKFSDQSEEGAYIDIEGQVKIAVTRHDYFKQWGENYITSLLMAHRQQRCNNFKDKGVAKYGGDLFEKERDIADEIFTDMPPPVPSRRPEASADNSASGGGSSFSMSNFNNADNPCFHENALVHMADGSKRTCSDIVKGDVVLSANGSGAAVVCVVKTECKNGVQQLVALDGGLVVTPWHPVRVAGTEEWKFPAELANTKDLACSAVYSFVLAEQHVVNINGLECVTLGHGIQQPVAQHEYFGTERVLRDLAAMPGFEDGLLCFQHGPVQKTEDGKVAGFNQARLQTILCSEAN
eukprot:CAMPEP_0181316250 /NCGR_PEP_ID=MMETSP1101-20121128/15796_1 /TAXON_ID=46948 /ORGANISM="Rhodomonas abbreviata, Strain Caron Lab Isolate" /LENGTH=652 /DNA_ID=CAMNT_0023423487 /DNA_START=36 /DNA_END=1994 /DNA_ORIENTATION=-